MNLYRHGDLAITQISQEEAKKLIVGDAFKHNKSFVLAEGETTGHKHLLTTSNVDDLNVFVDDQGRYILQVEKQATLTHEEHKQIDIMPGWYVVSPEREHDYFEKNVREVVD